MDALAVFFLNSDFKTKIKTKSKFLFSPAWQEEVSKQQETGTRNRKRRRWWSDWS